MLGVVHLRTDWRAVSSLWIILIVVLALALLGFFASGRSVHIL
jgi:hypothetical protein